MKVLSYNIYGIKNTTAPTPKWEVRQENIKRILKSEYKNIWILRAEILN